MGGGEDRVAAGVNEEASQSHEVDYERIVHVNRRVERDLRHLEVKVLRGADASLTVERQDARKQMCGDDETEIERSSYDE